MYIFIEETCVDWRFEFLFNYKFKIIFKEILFFIFLYKFEKISIVKENFHLFYKNLHLLALLENPFLARESKLKTKSLA